MFSDNKKNKVATSANQQQNRIVDGSKITGNIVSEGGFRIDGEIIGEITTKGKVVIGTKGKVEGTLTCANADIEGKFIGKLNVQGILSLKATAIIEGEVAINKLAVEPGAIFNATCTMGSAVKQLKREEKTA